jgi:hypothetical protein
VTSDRNTDQKGFATTSQVITRSSGKPGISLIQR